MKSLCIKNVLDAAELCLLKNCTYTLTSGDESVPNTQLLMLHLTVILGKACDLVLGRET